MNDQWIDSPSPDDMSFRIEQSVLEVLRNKKFYRYDLTKTGPSEVSLLEKEFAEYVGMKYALAVNSCTAALSIALFVLNIKPGDEVLIPAFTFIAVPSVVVQLGATVRLVEITENFYMDTNDFARKITPKTKVLLLSHMRGQIGNLEDIYAIAKQHHLPVIEDCAHTLGMRWKDQHIGSHSQIACHSMQSNKMLDSGEGGMLVTNDDDLFGKAIFYSGAYEKLWELHIAKPDNVAKWQKKIPCVNSRMSNITAAVLRPQLEHIEKKIIRHNKIYQQLETQLKTCPFIALPKRPAAISIAANSIQFRLMDLAAAEIAEFLNYCRQHRVAIHHFSGNNARCFWEWEFLEKLDDCPKTRAILEVTCDLKLAYDLSPQAVEEIGNTIIKGIHSAKKVVLTNNILEQ